MKVKEMSIGLDEREYHPHPPHSTHHYHHHLHHEYHGQRSFSSAAHHHQQQSRYHEEFNRSSGGGNYYNDGAGTFFGDDSGSGSYHPYIKATSSPPLTTASLSFPHLRHHHHSRNHGITGSTSPLVHLRSNLEENSVFGEHETLFRRVPSPSKSWTDSLAEMTTDHPHLANSTSWTKFSGNRSLESMASFKKTFSPVAAALEQFVNNSSTEATRPVDSTGNYFNSDMDEDLSGEEFGSGLSGDGESDFPNNFLNLSTMMTGDKGNGSGGGGESPSIRGNLYASIVPVMLFFCVLAVLVNLLIVISARWCRKPMSPTLYFSISLALADAYAAFILATGLVINSLLPYVFGYHVPMCLSLVVEAFRQGGVLVTVSHLLALAMNHWIGIVRPLHYAATMTRRTAWTVIIFSWICPITVIVIYYSIVPGEGFQSPACVKYNFLKERAYRAFFASCFFAPLILMSFIYIHIFIIVRNHHTHRQRYQSTQQLKRNVKAVLTTMLVLGTYIIGWMPATLFSLIACDDCIYKTESLSSVVRYSMGFTTNLLVILKTLVDPVIYAARMTDIQLALKKMRYDILMKFCKSCAPAAPPTPNDRGSFYETKSMRMTSFGARSSLHSQRTRMIANNAAAVATSASLLHRTGHNHHLQLNHHNYNHNNQQTHKQPLNNGTGLGGVGGGTNGYVPCVTTSPITNNNSSNGGGSSSNNGGTNEISKRSFLRNTQQPLITTKAPFESVEIH